jgi:proteic killer suppression protein
MILTFHDATTCDVFNGLNSKAARKLPVEAHPVAQRKMDLINAAKTLHDLRVPPGNRLEALKGDRKGFYSIRINEQWRIVFRWTVVGAEDVQVLDYH